MDPPAKTQKKQPSPVASQRQLKQTIQNFAHNFQSDGFLAFSGKPQINFVGRMIINYKGLGVIKFRKSQLQANQFNAGEFKKFCEEYIILPNKQDQLFQQLQKKYPGSSYCIISGGIFKSAGELIKVNRGLVTVFFY